MVKIDVIQDKLLFTVEGMDKLWSLRSQLSIPLSDIKDVYSDPSTAHE